jgi:hypothetical protein
MYVSAHVLMSTYIDPISYYEHLQGAKLTYLKIKETTKVISLLGLLLTIKK